MKSILKKLFATTLAIIMLFSVGNTAVIASASSAQNSVVLALDEEKTVTISERGGEAYIYFTPETDMTGSFIIDCNKNVNVKICSNAGILKEDCCYVYGKNSVEWQLAAGTEYYFIASFESTYYTGDFTVKVNALPAISDIVIEDYEMIENHIGSYVEDWNAETEQNETYFGYHWYTEYPYTVYFENGESVSGKGNTLNYNDKEYGFYTTDNQSVTSPWTVGNTYTPKVSVWGFEKELSVSIVETPVKSLTIEPISVIENYDGYKSGDYDENWEYQNYYRYAWEGKVAYTIEFFDGEEIANDYGQNFEYKGEDYYLSYSDDQGLKNQWTVGNTYNVTVSALGYEVEVPVTVVKTPVKNITFSPIDMIENTGGYWGSEWNDETNAFDKEYYHYNWHECNPTYTVEFENGDTITDSGVYLPIGNDSHYMFPNDDQSYDNAWKVGNSYNATVSVLGYTATVPVNIIASPVESIVFEPIELIENYNGSYYNQDQENEYFYYDWQQYLSYTINFNNGDAPVTGYGSYFEYNGQGYNLSLYDDQSYENQWKVGNTYPVNISALGCEAQVNVKINETPIESITAQPIEMIAGYDSYLNEGWNYEIGEYEEYTHYPWGNNLSYTVKFKDSDEVVTANSTSFEYQGEWYSVSTRDNQGPSTEWKVGDTYTATISALGYTADVPVSIVQSPVTNAVFEPIELLEKADGYIRNEGSDAEYFSYSFDEHLHYTIYLGDEEPIKVDGTSFEYNGKGRSLLYEDPQSFENQWVAGNTYNVTVSVLGYEVSVPVTIKASPIESIVVNPIELIAGYDGSTTEDYIDETESYEEYFKYSWGSKLSYTINFKDGTEAIIGNGNWVEYQGEEYYISRKDNQSYYNQWTAGNTYTATITALGFSTDVQIKIVDSPIDYITVNPLSLTVHSNGFWNNDWNPDTNKYDNEYYQYQWYDHFTYKIVFKNGDEVEGKTAWFTYNDEDYEFIFDTEQGFENEWTVGNTYNPTISLMGYTTTVPVTIKESPVESITVKPIKLIENIDGYHETEYDYDTESEVSYYKYDWRNNVSYTIKLKDGTEIEGNGGDFEYEDVYHNIHTKDDQSYSNVWTSDNVGTATLSVWGYTVDVPITILKINATPITPNINKNASITFGGEKVFFSFTPETSGLYGFESLANDDTVADLYDSNFELLESNDDGANDSNFMIIRKLEAGQTYYFAARYYNKEKIGSFPVLLTKYPEITDIEFKPIEIISGTNGYITNDWDEESQEYKDYYYYEWKNLLSYTVHLSTGETIESNGSSFNYNGKNYYLTVSDNQSYMSKWTAENNYTATVDVWGYSEDVTVSIITTPIESVTVNPIIITAYTNGYWYGEEGGTFIYEWEYNNLLSYTVKFKNGDTAEYVNDWVDYNGASYRINIEDNQSYDNPWYPGNTYTIPVTVLGYTFDVKISILEENAYEDYTYLIQEGNAIITGISGEGDVLDIPETVNGYRVTSIISLGNARYKEIIIPDCVTSLSLDMLSDCSDVEKITIGAGVTAISSKIFRYSANLKEIVVSEANTEYASFDGIVYDKAVTKMLAIPRAKITTHIVPSTVTNIDAYIKGSYKFDIDLTQANTDYTMEDGILYDKDKTIIYSCSPNKTGEYTMPDTVKTITDCAFMKSALSEVTVSDNVSKIVYYAFAESVDLEKVVLPDTLSSIDESAFEGCESLSDITLPSSLKYLGEKAFRRSAIKTVTIPAGIRSIEYGTFYSTPLESVILPEGLAEIGSGAFSRTVLESVNLPDSVRNVYSQAFYGTPLESVKLSSSLEYIGDAAFARTNISELFIPSSVLTIGESAFENCKIKKVSLSEGVTSIGKYAFRYNQFDTLDLPDSVTSIAYKSFNSVKQLANIDLPNNLEQLDGYAFHGTTWYEKKADGPVYLEDALYHYKGTMPQNASVTVASGTRLMADYAFEDYKTLTKVTLPLSLERIGEYAFLGCESLQHVYYEGDEDDRDSIIMDWGNEQLLDAEWHYNTCYHSWKKATCTKPQICSKCGATQGKPIAHSYKSTVTKATTKANGKIVKKCSCGATTTTTIKYVKSFSLSTTSYTYNGSVKTPTVTVKDSAGKKLIKDTDYTVSYASGRKNAGTYKVVVTLKGNYSGSKTLSFKINPISYSKCKFSLSTTDYTYNGKKKTPSVTVKDANGKKLTKDTHYTVSYASGRKNVGSYKVTIKMKGNYSGTKTLTFKINPVKTSVSKLKAGKKPITVTISKKSTQVKGYQIQYSTSKKFTSSKTKTISSYKTTKYTLKSLKAKKTYYVRVRTYKTVDGKKYYSDWSSSKKTKTK